MAHKKALDARPPKRVMLVIVLFLLLLAVFISTTLAWTLGISANRDSAIQTAGYGGGLVRLLAYDAKIGDGGEPVIDLDSSRVLDNGLDTLDDTDEYRVDANGDPVLDGAGNPIRNTLFTEQDLLPGSDTIVKFLVIENNDLTGHGFYMNFVHQMLEGYSPENSFLAEAICTNVYYCGNTLSAAETNLPTGEPEDYDFYHVGTDELIQKPIPGSVEAALLPDGGEAIPGLSVYRLEFTYSGTSSDIYDNQGFGLDAYVSVGQYEAPDPENDNKYDRRLAIRTFEELAYAFATLREDGSTPLTPEDRQTDERRARVGDTVYILDDITIPAGREIALTYPVNLYLYGNISFADSTARFNIDIPAAVSADVHFTMDIGEENGDGRFLFPEDANGNRDFSVMDTLALPDDVVLNWFSRVTDGLIPSAVAAPPDVQPAGTFPVANFSVPVLRRIDPSA